jgi:tetratricopeptide (TPR) repeat protein
VEVGQPVPEAQLQDLTSQAPSPLLLEGKACLFLLFRPGQKHTLEGLTAVASLQPEFEPRGVRFVAVTTDRYPASAATEALAAAGARMPILVDNGEEFFASLGVRVTPTVGLVDARHRLAAWEPYRRIQFRDILAARLKFMLGDIGEKELEKAIAPDDASEGDDAIVARRYLNLGRLLLKSGDLEKARHSARRALEKNPKLAAAHALLGQIALADKDCDEAQKAFGAALALDPSDGEASAGRERCAKGQAR